MALVTIVYAVTADRLGPDLTRIGTVEDIPADLARMMVHDGSARWPSEEELADHEEVRVLEEKAEAVVASGEDLSKMLKADLLALAAERGVEGVDESMTKAEIAKAIEAHDPQPAESPTLARDATPAGDGGAYGAAPAGAFPQSA